jgi:YQGE family putative transporter
MNRLRKEVEVFLRCPRSMRVLIVSNMIYALVLPVIDVFVAAYVMRNSHAVARVVTYQLAVYAATPVAFYLNGILLGRVAVKHLYAAGMLLSGGGDDAVDAIGRPDAHRHRDLGPSHGRGHRPLLGQPRIPCAGHHQR